MNNIEKISNLLIDAKVFHYVDRCGINEEVASFFVNGKCIVAFADAAVVTLNDQHGDTIKEYKVPAAAVKAALK